jgi:hypothetical protein
MEKKAKHYFDITKRPLSWSAISSFEWNREQWFAKYVTGEKPVDTPELIFGKEVDERLQEDPTFLPEIVRYEELQFKMECKLGKYALIGTPIPLDILFTQAKYLCLGLWPDCATTRPGASLGTKSALTKPGS